MRSWRTNYQCCNKSAILKKTNKIYKDNWVNCKICKTDNKGNSARTSKPIIESGRQRSKWTQPFTKVAAGYHQYRHNIRCSSYERSLEKFDVTPSLTNDAWAFLESANINIPRHVYAKSGCYSCCNCCVKTQVVLFQNQTGSILLNNNILTYSLGLNTFPPFSYEIQPGIIVEPYAVWLSGNPSILWNAIVFIRDRDGDCTGASTGNPFVSSYINRDTLVTTSQVVNLDYNESKCQNVTNLKQTIYKRSNKKFAANGAVSSGGRIARLKLDTIQGNRIQKRIYNGACEQIQCNSSSNTFTQGYRSAKPRFITNPKEGGAKTAGFPPTQWRNAYIARGKVVGNIIIQKECKNC